MYAPRSCPTPSYEQDTGQLGIRILSLLEPPSLDLAKAEGSIWQLEVGYAHESKHQSHMSYPSSQTGHAGISQEIAEVLPHEPTSHDIVNEGDEEENELDTKTSYDATWNEMMKDENAVLWTSINHI